MTFKFFFNEKLIYTVRSPANSAMYSYGDLISDGYIFDYSSCINDRKNRPANGLKNECFYPLYTVFRVVSSIVSFRF